MLDYYFNQYGEYYPTYMNEEIKDYYRYYLIKELDESYKIKMDKFPLKVIGNKIIGYQKYPDDNYSHCPSFTSEIGVIREGYLWLEEDDIYKAAEIFKDYNQSLIDHDITEIHKLEKHIQARKETVHKINEFLDTIQEKDCIEK